MRLADDVFLHILITNTKIRNNKYLQRYVYDQREELKTKLNSTMHPFRNY